VLFGIRSTGKQLSFERVDIYRTAGHKFVERWTQYDQLALLRQLGISRYPTQTPGGFPWHSHA
jgi:predicted ester cyclase